jgi:hypothetical protein
MLRLLACLLCAPLAVLAAEDTWVIGPEGAARHAEVAETLTRPIRFTQPSASGMQATFIARSLRGVKQDDWRRSQTVAGTRRDAAIDFPTAACGDEQDRRRFGISGRPGDWDDFSVQWDGVIRIPVGGADLATRSDDGSRLWVDRNRDDQVQADEWGVNGWGGGQGATLRQVHAAVPGGSWPIRLQFEEGGGGNACSLLWRTPDAADWQPVPPDAFAQTPTLELTGPITLQAVFSGSGELRCGTGVVIETPPTGCAVVISGMVSLGADLAAQGSALHITAGAVLDLAGHALEAGRIDGGGTVQLSGGTLRLDTAQDLAVRGHGRLICRGALTLARLDATVVVELADAQSAVRSPERSVLSQPLAAPLATVLELGQISDATSTLVIDLDGPLAGAGLIAWRADRHGRWFQRIVAPCLSDGRQRLAVDLSASAPLLPFGHQAAWNAATAAESPRVGVLVYADRPLSGMVRVDASWQATAHAAGNPHLTGLMPPPSRVRTGRRIEVAASPDPFPLWPLDPDCFALELAVTAPDATVTRYAGFVDQPFRRVDRGDRELLLADGPPRFLVRWRARQAGVHHLRLEATWADGGHAVVDLPDLTAEGPDWDDIARVDPGDPRFLSSQGSFVWPIGQNLNSTYDTRSRGALRTKLTPDRGTYVREALLERLAAAGGSGGETWLSPWNLGLEWVDAWPGYHGAGRPNLGNAWALDRYLDLAESHGMRIVLSIFNHGQGRDGSGAEDDWPHHPWRLANGGWLDGPPGLFTDARALHAQSNLFRYLAARWGDSPALLTWKLWAEVNLVHVPIEPVRAWHASAAELFAKHDPWHHPVTTHWCGDWHSPDPEIAALPGMQMLTIDAYHGESTMIAELLGSSTRAAGSSAGLARYGKPVLVTEYGGSAGGCAPQRMEAELAIGGWAAFVHGHAGAPMLWWFEWIDQGSRYASFGALHRFTAGEDLRDPRAHTVRPDLRAGDGRLWCRAWQRPGRMLGYALDPDWAVTGGESREFATGSIDLGQVAPGGMTMQWWDADQGIILATTPVDHPGGLLRLPVPAFKRHIAFKLWRSPAATAIQ